MKNYFCDFIKYQLIIFSILFCFSVSSVFAAQQVILEWDPNIPTPQGYKAFMRIEGESYDYNNPAWTGTETTCVIENLADNQNYYFVVRAFDNESESGDSNEVSHETVPSNQNLSADAGPDQIVNQGIQVSLNGSNSSGPDGQTISYQWTQIAGPSVNLSGSRSANSFFTAPDSDVIEIDLIFELAISNGSGLTAVDHCLIKVVSEQYSSGNSPDQPIITGSFENNASVSLTPFFGVNENHDHNGYEHIMTRWQISTEPDFSNYILDISSSLYLYSYQVPHLILDTDTTYYWRAKFYYQGDVESTWSEFQAVTTITAQESDDTDLNGIPDAQEIDEALDLDENGINDLLQDNMLAANSMIGSCQIGVKSISENTSLVALKPVADNYGGHALQGQPESMTLGLICFKLYLSGDETSATVKVYFSKKAGPNAKWFKYDSNEGWQSDETAVFSDDRKSVILTLVDGGFGDEDGVRNGIIVDPSGLGNNTASVETESGDSIMDLNVDSTDIAGCFIGSVKDNSKQLEKSENRPLFKSACLWFLLALLLFAGLYSKSCEKP